MFSTKLFKSVSLQKHCTKLVPTVVSIQALLHAYTEFLQGREGMVHLQQTHLMVKRFYYRDFSRQQLSQDLPNFKINVLLVLYLFLPTCLKGAFR